MESQASVGETPDSVSISHSQQPLDAINSKEPESAEERYDIQSNQSLDDEQSELLQDQKSLALTRTTETNPPKEVFGDSITSLVRQKQGLPHSQLLPADDGLFFGIRVKPGINVWNVLSIPYILALLTSGVIYCSTRMLFMLRDPEYFNIENAKIGTVNSDLIFNAMLGSIPISLAAGYCYDIFGRKILIIGNALLMCVLCYLTPLTAPSLQLLQYNYIFVRSTMVFVSCNPLVVDYVERDSLGRASALSNIGGIVGDIFSMGFLITVTEGMTHEYAFFVIALILAALTAPLLWMLKEPEVTLAKEAALKKDDSEQDTDAEGQQETTNQAEQAVYLPDELNRRGRADPEPLENNQNQEVIDSQLIKLSYFDQITYLTKRCFTVSISDVKYSLCFLAVFVARPVNILFTVYCLMWILSFVDSGVIENDDEAQKIYQKISVVAMLGTALALPFLGYWSDKVGPHLTMPLSFAFRAVVGTLFLFIEDPDTVLARLLCSCIIISSAMQSASIEVLFMRTIPQDIRGSMVGAMNLFANLGMLAFTFFGGRAFDAIGPTSPFMIMSVGDWIVFGLATILACLGFLRT